MDIIVSTLDAFDDVILDVCLGVNQNYCLGDDSLRISDLNSVVAVAVNILGTCLK